NGSGKSTLSKVIAGHPEYQLDSGSIEYNINGKLKDLTDFSSSDRAREGIFLGFQYPVEIPGVTNITFMHEAFNAVATHQGASEVGVDEFRTLVKSKLPLLKMSEHFLDRSVN